MNQRKKKLLFFQIFFLVLGVIIIFFTYNNKNNEAQEQFVSKKIQKEIEKKDINNSNVFYNVKYSGFDLEGNRYTINSAEAINSKENFNEVMMKEVMATFYLKDDTILKITSAEGKYNNNTLDMMFSKDVKAVYNDSELYAEKAEFKNSDNLLTISDKVKVVDSNGTILADKLTFDIERKKLNISSSANNIIKSNIIYK